MAKSAVAARGNPSPCRLEGGKDERKSDVCCPNGLGNLLESAIDHRRRYGDRDRGGLVVVMSHQTLIRASRSRSCIAHWEVTDNGDIRPRFGCPALGGGGGDEGAGRRHP